MNVEEDILVKLQKELRFTKIIVLCSMLITICLLLCGALMINRFHGLSEETEYIIESVSEIDMDTFNLSLVTINKLMESVNGVLESVDWVEVSNTVTQLDVEALNEAIEGLDTAEISEAVKNLNVAVEKVKELSEMLNKLKALVDKLW